MTLLSLRDGHLLVEIDPEAGGSVARFAVHDRDILRPGPNGRGGTQGACFPLVPYSNRIANGRFEFDGKVVTLPANWPHLRHPMHGDGWSAAWQVVHADSTSASIAYEHDGQSGWPFRYRAVQEFRLRAGRLAVGLRLENREAYDVPGGMGLHPFFVREPDCQLAFRAASVWLADVEVLPISRVGLPPRWDFSRGERPDAVALDNCFDGWDGTATVTWPSRQLKLELRASEIFRHAVVFTPRGRPFFCFEPVSHANGQIGRTRLAAGGALAGEIIFAISDL